MKTEKTLDKSQVEQSSANQPAETTKPTPIAGPSGESSSYGNRLTASIEQGAVVIRIGVQTLAHAVTYAEWANPYDEEANDYIRTFAIEDEHEFAADVVRAMLAEREDGATPLTMFLDKMSEEAVNEGSLGLHEEPHRIVNGQTAPCETWAIDPREEPAP
jgi:hypothetical protein